MVGYEGSAKSVNQSTVLLNPHTPYPTPLHLHTCTVPSACACASSVARTWTHWSRVCARHSQACPLERARAPTSLTPACRSGTGPQSSFVQLSPEHPSPGARRCRLALLPLRHGFFIQGFFLPGRCCQEARPASHQQTPNVQLPSHHTS